MIERKNWITGVTAPKNGGKTYFVRNLILKFPRVLIFDPADDEYGGHRIVGRPKDAQRAMRSGKWKIHYVPILLNHKQGRAIEAPGLENCSALAWQAGNCLFVVDEAHLVCSPWTVPENLMKLIRLGRHRAVSIIWISHSFSGVARMLTENTDEYVFFRITEPLQFEAIAKRCGWEVANKVRNLKHNCPGQIPERLHYFSADGRFEVRM